MQPPTKKGYTPKALHRLKRKFEVSKICNLERDNNPSYAYAIPFEVGIKLTNRCDLRCEHCFQWNDGGYHNHMDKPRLSKGGDLDIRIIEDVIAFTESTQAMLYLWGGEPLIYNQWDQLIELLAKNPRETVICTNGLTIEKKLDGLCTISEQLTLLVSIEGLESVHDSLRGKNTFSRTMRGLDALLEKKQLGEFKGMISVAAVIADNNIDSLYEFCLYFEQKGIETLYLNFPWYIPEETAFGMDDLFRTHYDWMGTDRGFLNSWHSFDFHISEDKIPALLEQLNRLREKVWDIRIRLQPDLDAKDIIDFVRGGTRPGQHKTRCLGISNRLDILPDGRVTPCKKFIEFVTGDLGKASLAEIWTGPRFQRFRTVHNNTLMPICSKCEILYMNGS